MFLGRWLLPVLSLQLQAHWADYRQEVAWTTPAMSVELQLAVAWCTHVTRCLCKWYFNGIGRIASCISQSGAEISCGATCRKIFQVADKLHS